MAKDTEKTPTQEAAIIGKAEFKKLLKKLDGQEAEMNEAKGEMGGTVESAIAKFNLHKDALRLVRKYRKKSPAQQLEFKVHLDAYFDHAELAQPESDLVETPAERRKKMTKPEIEEEDRLSQGTHVVKGGKIVSLSEVSTAS